MSKVNVLFNATNGSTYFCDWCYKETLNSNDYSINREYFNTKSKNDFMRHIKSAKHCRRRNEAFANDDKIECKECNLSYTPEGYENHCKRNNELFNTIKPVKQLEIFNNVNCNNFVFNKKRYPSISNYNKQNGLDKPKQRRNTKNKKVFKIKRPAQPVRYVPAPAPPPPPPAEDEAGPAEESDDDGYDKEWIKPVFEEECDNCCYGINEGYSDKHLEFFNTLVCEC